MDGQYSSHGSAYAYSNTAWPEFYDLWLEKLFGPEQTKESIIFWEALEDLLRIRPDGPPITVLDVGTGTGRVLKVLCESAVRHDWDLKDRVEIWGIDHGPAMIERAIRTFPPSISPRPNFVVASASNLASVPATASLEANVDLLIFAAGGIGHLVKDGEMQEFLGCVARALRRGDGVQAIVSVLEETRYKTENPNHDDVPGAMTIPSRDFPGKFYHKTATLTEWNEDRTVRTDKFELIMSDDAASAGGMFRDHGTSLRWSLRVFDEGKWEAAIKLVGLEISKKQHDEIQTWYHLKLREPPMSLIDHT